MGDKGADSGDVLPQSSDAILVESGRVARSPEEIVGYAVYGDPGGEPVVMAHPTPGSRTFGRLIADEARTLGVRLIVPERLGYGLSTTRSRVRRLASVVGIGKVGSRTDAVDRVLRSLDVEQFGVLGFSSGCPFALGIAASAPGSTTGVALVSPTTPYDAPGKSLPLRERAGALLRTYDGTSGEVADPGSPPIVRTRRRKHPLLWLQSHLHDVPAEEILWLYGGTGVPQSLVTTLRLELSTALTGSRSAFTMERRFLTDGWGVDFDAIDARPAILNGAESELTPPDAGRYLGRKLDGADLGVVDGEGHLSTLLATAETALRQATPSSGVETDVGE